MWGAVKRIFIAEWYSRLVVTLLVAILAAVGLSAAGRESLAGTALFIAVMAVVYRLKFGRW